MCITGAQAMTRPKGRMDVNSYRRVIDDLATGLWLVQFWNQGEPFLHPDFLEMVAYAKSKGVMAMTSTNGHFLNENAGGLVDSGLDEIIVSLDGTDQETYASHRVGGNFETVVSGIRTLVAMKEERKSRRPLVNLQCLVLKQNEDQISEILELGRDLGVDVVTLKSVQVYSDEQAETFLPEDENFRRYEKRGESYQVKSELPNWCRFLWVGAVLNCDGSLAPCCFDKDNELAFGNAFNSSESSRQIWKGEKSMNFRNAVLEDRSRFEICRNCLEGLKQSYVHYQVL